VAKEKSSKPSIASFERHVTKNQIVQTNGPKDWIHLVQVIVFVKINPSPEKLLLSAMSHGRDFVE
jgi:hypothetical protein